MSIKEYILLFNVILVLSAIFISIQKISKLES